MEAVADGVWLMGGILVTQDRSATRIERNYRWFIIEKLTERTKQQLS